MIDADSIVCVNFAYSEALPRNKKIVAFAPIQICRTPGKETNMERKRNIKKQLWLSEKENTALQQKAAKCNITEADFIRMMILNTEPKTLPSKEILLFRKELGYLCATMNQLLTEADSAEPIDSQAFKSSADRLTSFIDEFEKKFFNREE